MTFELFGLSNVTLETVTNPRVLTSAIPKKTILQGQISPVVNIKIAGIMDDILDDYGLP